MAPEISNLKNEYENSINFVFLNVDNSKWENYLRKFEVNGIPQMNIFDKDGNLETTFIGKQEENNIKQYLDKLEDGFKSSSKITNLDYSPIKENHNNAVAARSHS